MHKGKRSFFPKKVDYFFAVVPGYKNEWNECSLRDQLLPCRQAIYSWRGNTTNDNVWLNACCRLNEFPVGDGSYNLIVSAKEDDDLFTKVVVIACNKHS